MLTIYNNNIIIDLEDVDIPRILLFDPNIYEIEVPVEIYVPNNLLFSEERREFSISILETTAINATGTFSSVEGDPIKITIYDNDCKHIF